MQNTQVAIVGAGPIRLELAAVLKHMGVPYLQMDAGQVGQTITWYPNQARFFSSPDRIAIAGVPLHTHDQSKATREEYLAYLRAVVQQHQLKIRSYERVTNIQREDNGNGFVVTSDHRGLIQQTRAQHVVLAIGDMHRPRDLNIPGEDLPHVSHYFRDPHPFFGQKLLIVGGKNSAVEAALRCDRAGARVSLSYRQDTFNPKHVKYWLLPEINALIKAGRIRYHPHTVPVKVKHELVELQNVQSGEHTDVSADFVLLLTGYEMDPTLYRSAGIELTGVNHTPTYDASTMQTNVPGLYVAGTGAAGTQNQFSLFIENSHPHVAKIAKAITGLEPPAHLINSAAETYALPES